MSTLDEITKEKQRIGEALARVDASASRNGPEHHGRSDSMDHPKAAFRREFAELPVRC
jgi:hypothetical protein